MGTNRFMWAFAVVAATLSIGVAACGGGGEGGVRESARRRARTRS